MNPRSNKLRLRIAVRGAVQGVGFRPFIYRLAGDLGLTGTVNNSAQGVLIEAEGPRDLLETFADRICIERPARSAIHGMELTWLDPTGYSSFQIVHSEGRGPKSALVLPDIATCDDCRQEILDPANRRYSYPFTNCTHCGPRFSIIRSLPYDRENTSMGGFVLCPQCRAEYEDPANRRFHAQPNACAICGPHLELWDRSGTRLAGKPGDSANAVQEILGRLKDLLLQGRIVAVKGLGGFHLMVDASNADAVARLRLVKNREEKPFAVMYPDLAGVERDCEASPAERRLLLSPESPIVLLRAKESTVAENVAPGNPFLGVLLPYTPLHLLLLRCCGLPLVATSGNLADEPICIDEREALHRLSGVAEFFLVHNRPIVRHVDDSIARIVNGCEMLLRRARGYAPMPVISTLLRPDAPAALAAGAHLKNAVSVSSGNQIFLSQHIGDIETEAAFQAFQNAIQDLQSLHELRPGVIAADGHPDYLSSRFARELASRTNIELRLVQHHEAHVWSCMAENEVAFPALGVAWDGTGYGTDGTIWGGEFFVAEQTGLRRIAHLRQFRLPGGDQAVKEPRRSALGLLFGICAGAEEAFDLHPQRGCFNQSERRVISRMLERNFNSPITSSMGRLFDAVASLLGLRQIVRHEGQAAMALEFAARELHTVESYPAHIQHERGIIILDWEPMIRALIEDISKGIGPQLMAARFHRTLVEWIVRVAKAAQQERIVLSGGCFQNVYLAETAVERLTHEGFRPYLHQRVPPNDGGIALGQIIAARAPTPSDSEVR